MNFLNNTETIGFLINAVIGLAVILGGLWAFRVTVKKTKRDLHAQLSQETQEIQERAINAMQSEISTLHTQMGELQKESARKDQLLDTVIKALAAQGIHITIDGQMVFIHQRSTNSSTTTTRIQGAGGQ